MMKHQFLLKQENAKLKEQNEYLEKLVQDAQERVKSLSSSLQKGLVNVMPSITVCNDLIEAATSGKEEAPSTGFASAGSVKLDEPALCLDERDLIAAGQTNGAISLWAATQPEFSNETSTKTKTRNSSGTLYRFSTEIGPEPETNNPLVRKSNPLFGHSCPVTSVKWFDDNTLSSVSLDATLKLWDIRTARMKGSVQLECPSVSHTVIDQTYGIASCTNKIIHVDPRESDIGTSIETKEIITSIQQTDLGLLIGTETGKIMMIDPRLWKPYQSIQLSPAFLPISKISGTSEVTVTCFDGVVRTIGNELPLFVSREYVRAPIMGSIIGSCVVSLSSKDDFVVSGSTGGKAIVWPKTGSSHELLHSGSTVYDCVNISSFVGSFVTCDSSSHLTMWACSFNDVVEKSV